MDRYQRVEKPRPESVINENEIRITTQGLIRNYISYATTLLQEKHAREIVLKAMGQAISKTVAVVEFIKKRIPRLHQETAIGSVSITDVWEPIEEGLVPLEMTRHVSMISITLSNRVLNRDSPGYQAPIAMEQVKPQYRYQQQPQFKQTRPPYNPQYNDGNDDSYGRGWVGRGRGRGRGRGWGGYENYQDNGGYSNWGRGGGRGRGWGYYGGEYERGGGGYERGEGYERGRGGRGGYQRGGMGYPRGGGEYGRGEYGRGGGEYGRGNRGYERERGGDGYERGNGGYERGNGGYERDNGGYERGNGGYERGGGGGYGRDQRRMGGRARGRGGGGGRV